MSVSSLIQGRQDPEEVRRGLENVGVATVGGTGDLESLIRQLAMMQSNPAALVTGEQAGPNILPTTSAVAEAVGVDEHWLYQMFGMDPGGPLGDVMKAISPLLAAIVKKGGGKLTDKGLSRKFGDYDIEVAPGDPDEDNVYAFANAPDGEQIGIIKSEPHASGDRMKTTWAQVDDWFTGEGIGSEMYRALGEALGRWESDDFLSAAGQRTYEGFNTKNLGLKTEGDAPPYQVRYLDPSPEGRAARAQEQGYTDQFHGTFSDWDQIDEDKVDLGLHVGSWDQATNRLSDVTVERAESDAPKQFARARNKYDEGANIKPLKVRLGNSLKLGDVGRWDDSVNVLGRLKQELPEFEDMYHEAAQELDAYRYMDTDEPWVNSPENRGFLDEIRYKLKEQGYDSISYENLVENRVFGGRLTLEAEKALESAQQKLAALQSAMEPRREPFPSMSPDFGNDEYDRAIAAWRKKNSGEALATPEEREQMQALKAEIKELKGQRLDSKSYIILDPGGVRNRNAEFDPERIGEPDMNAMNNLDALMGAIARTA